MTTNRQTLRQLLQAAYNAGHSDAGAPPPEPWNPTTWHLAAHYDLDAELQGQGQGHTMNSGMAWERAMEARLEQLEDRLRRLPRAAGHMAAHSKLDARLTSVEREHRLAQKLAGERFDRVLRRYAELRDCSLPVQLTKRVDQLTTDLRAVELAARGAQQRQGQSQDQLRNDMRARLGSLEAQLQRVAEESSASRQNVATLWDRLGENDARAARTESVASLQDALRVHAENLAAEQRLRDQSDRKLQAASDACLEALAAISKRVEALASDSCRRGWGDQVNTRLAALERLADRQLPATPPTAPQRYAARRRHAELAEALGVPSTLTWDELLLELRGVVKAAP